MLIIIVLMHYIGIFVKNSQIKKNGVGYYTRYATRSNRML